MGDDASPPIPMACQNSRCLDFAPAGMTGDFLFEVLYEFDVQTVRGIDVAEENDGHVLPHGVFDLYQLVLSSAGV